MKRIIIWILVMVFLLPIVYAQDEIDWGKDDSWTAENVASDPAGAFEKDPQRAFQTNPGAVISHVTSGTAAWQGSAVGITITGTRLKNRLGPVLENIDQYPTGTVIMPDGEMGFKVLLPGKDGPTEVVIGGEEVTSVKYDTAKEEFSLTIDGKEVEINPAGMGFNVQGIRMELVDGQNARLNIGGKWTNVNVKGDTYIQSMGDGFKLQGNFQAQFEAEIDGELVKVSVPSILESKAVEYFETGPITLDLMTGKSNPYIERSVVWDGKYLRGQSTISLSIIKGDNEMVQVVGIGKDTVFRVSQKGVVIEKNPSLKDMRKQVIKDIKEKREIYEKKMKDDVRPRFDILVEKLKNKEGLSDYDKERIVSISGMTHERIKTFLDTLVEEKKISRDEAMEMSVLGYQKEIIQKRIDKLPDWEKGKKNEIGYVDGYAYSDLDKNPVELVGIVKVKDNVVFPATMDYVVGKNEYQLKPAKVSLFSDSMAKSDGTGNEFTFSALKETGWIKKEIYQDDMWQLHDGKLYELDDGKQDEPVEFYADINVKVDPDHMEIDGELTRTIKELVSAKVIGGGYAMEKVFKGVKLKLLDIGVEGNTVRISQNLNDQMGKLNNVRLATALVKKYMPSQIATRIKEEVYSRNNMDFAMQALDRVAEQHILSENAVQTLQDGLKESFTEVRDNEDFMTFEKYHGMDITYRQIDADNGEISLVLKGEPKDVTISKKHVKTEGIDIPKEFKANAADVSKARSTMEIYQNFVKKIQ